MPGFTLPAQVPLPDLRDPPSTGRPKPPSPSHKKFSVMERRGSRTLRPEGERSPRDKLCRSGFLPSPCPYLRASLLPPTGGLTCAGTISQSCAGDRVLGALRPQLSAGCARPPGSQSLGSTGLAEGRQGLQAGVPELPGSVAAIPGLRPSPRIRGGLLCEISPSPGAPHCSFPSGRRQKGSPGG